MRLPRFARNDSDGAATSDGARNDRDGVRGDRDGAVVGTGME